LISGAEAYLAPGRTNPIYLEGKLPLVATTATDLGLREGQVVQASVRLERDLPMLMLQGRTLPMPGLSASQAGESIWLRAQGGNLVPINPPPLVSRIANLLYRPEINSVLPQIFQPGPWTHCSARFSARTFRHSGAACNSTWPNSRRGPCAKP